MKLILDTCTFLWIIWDSPRLSPVARDLFENGDNEVYLSTVSCWEISVKHTLGKLPLPVEPRRLVPDQRQRHGIASLALDEEAVLLLGSLPTLHRDPFDRMLVCQAISAAMTILTPDERVRAYPVKTMW